MKKKLTLVFSSLILFLVACGDSSITTEQPNNEPGIYEPDYNPENGDDYQVIGYYPTVPEEVPHPFAIELQQILDYPDTETRAILVDIDGNQTSGMLVTTFWYNDEGYFYNITGTLFYLHDKTLHIKDMGNQWSAVTRTTLRDNRLVHLFGDAGVTGFTLFQMDGWQVVDYLILEIEHSPLYDELIWYFLNREEITTDEFHEIYNNYGLGRDNIRNFTDEEMQAEIEYILSMTITAE